MDRMLHSTARHAVSGDYSSATPLSMAATEWGQRQPRRPPAVESTAFGKLLRRHRDAAGLTQDALAEKAGLSARTVSDLERGARGARGHPHPHTLDALAKALELTP